MAVVWVNDPGATPPRVGYAISRKVGAAVVRNRIRRRLRALVAESAPSGGIYLISVAPAGASSSFGELKSHVNQVFEHIRTQSSPQP